MVLYLGIDGGGSGCRAAVCDGAGRELGRGSGGPANIWTAYDAAAANVRAAAAEALAAAGASTRSGEVRAVLGLAGANVSAAGELLAAGLPFARARVVTDVAIAVRGALGAGDGVAALIGTGSVYGVQRAGEVRVVGGWGFQLGDQGGGAWLGRRLCEMAFLAHDGMVPGSALLASVLAEAGGPAGLVAWGAAAGPADFAALVPRLVAAAAEDPAAEAILREADAAIATAIGVLGQPGEPVCFLGGLGPVFAARTGLATLAPRGTGLDGALAMARELP